MDGNRHGALSDAALDRELDAALNVDPSPEFQARVRLRVARDEAATGWRFEWRLAGVMAAVATLALAVITLWPAAQPSVPRAAVTAVPAVAEATTSERPVPPSVALPTTPRIAGPGLQASPAEAPPTRLTALAPIVLPLPEVLVSADEVRAYEMLFAIVRPEPSPPAARAGDTGPSETVELEDLAIVPLRIEPLPQMARVQTGELQ
jgi:hypothetical protein